MAGHVEQRRWAHADPAQQRRRTSRPHGPAGQRTPYQHRAGRRHVTGARRRRPTSRSLGTPSGTTNHQDAACLTIRNGGHRRCGGDRRLAGGAVPRDCAPEIQIYDTYVGANAPGSIHTSSVSHSFQCDGWLQRTSTFGSVERLLPSADRGRQGQWCGHPQFTGASRCNPAWNGLVRRPLAVLCHRV
jgi:hypothetical protein